MMGQKKRDHPQQKSCQLSMRTYHQNQTFHPSGQHWDYPPISSSHQTTRWNVAYWSHYSHYYPMLPSSWNWYCCWCRSYLRRHHHLRPLEIVRPLRHRRFRRRFRHRCIRIRTLLHCRSWFYLLLVVEAVNDYGCAGLVACY